jgi:hypothetical protein
MTTTSNAQGKIQFIQNHQTALDAGKYTIDINQTITINSEKPVNQEFKSSLVFVVTGDPFELNPQDIHTVFPPAGSSGDHAHVFPHIVLKRSTLPWEMNAQVGEEIAPWLALLVIYEEETQGESPSVLPIRTLTLDKLNSAINSQDLYEKEEDTSSKKIGKIYFPGLGNISDLNFSTQTGHHLTDKVTVLDIKKGLLQTILPSLDDLRYLAHVRQPSWNIIDNSSVYSIIRVCENIDKEHKLDKLKFSKNNEDNIIPDKEYYEDKLSELKSIIDALTIGTIPEIIKTHLKLSDQAFLIPSEGLATIIANRLPKDNGTSTVYLVSLHNRYDKNGLFDYSKADNDSYIRFITLKSWSFSCPKDSELSFSVLLQNLAVSPSKNHDKVDQDKKIADQYLNKGYIPLPHSLRQGGKTFSWYHSPLIPAIPSPNTSPPDLASISIRCADQLIAYDEQYGLFDVSYAAAWQLGQLLALQDQKFAISLFNWKRSNIQKKIQDDQIAFYPHFFSNEDKNINDDLDFTKDQDIKSWFEKLGLLYNVPFNYLVPDEKILPQESIYFFYLDWFWVESLLDGAFSIGRVQQKDIKHDKENSISQDKLKIITGFLLRSQVVSGWPDLQIEGFDDKQNKLELLRGDRLSTDVMICLFDGIIQQLDISLKPEGLHFGFDVDEKNKEQLFLTLRDTNGQLPTLEEEKKKYRIDLNNDLWNNRDRVIKIKSLSDEIDGRSNRSNEDKKNNPFTSEDLALQLIQGAAKVYFKLKS